MKGKDRQFAVGLALVLVTIAVYARVLGHDFVGYDDTDYVVENAHVRGGLSAASVAWAFTTDHASNWHPLTWLSHMLDCTLFGLRPGLHHLTSLLLHAANAVLLFLGLERATGCPARSAFVAALFALHPLHVESVAWIAERKDVLSGLFFMLTLLAWTRHVERPGSGRYVVALLLFALGLLAKPMLVTLPFVLMLLDVWPYARLGRSRGAALVREKAPFLALAALSSLVTFLVQRRSGAVVPALELSFDRRLANAVVAYVGYLGQAFWPRNLAVFYPYPSAWSAGQVAASALVLVTLTLGALAALRRRPWLCVGWLWYLGMLVPVIGLVQVGSQAMADRYTYLPLIGVFVVLAWGAAELVGNQPRRRAWAGAAAAVVLAASAAATWAQTAHWSDTTELFEHALRATDDNFLAHKMLGKSLHERGRLEEAAGHFAESLRRVSAPETENDLGVVLAKLGRSGEAMLHFERALELRPDYPAALANVGKALADRGRAEEALARFDEAVRLEPADAELRNSYGAGLAALGRPAEAIAQYEAALRLDPDQAEAHNGLGTVLVAAGRPAEALAEFERAASLRPESADFRYNLGAVLLALGRTAEARTAFAEALRLAPGHRAAARALKLTERR